MRCSCPEQCQGSLSQSTVLYQIIGNGFVEVPHCARYDTVVLVGVKGITRCLLRGIHIVDIRMLDGKMLNGLCLNNLVPTTKEMA